MSILLALLVIAPCALPSQASFNPNDLFYRYGDAWEGKGIITALRRLRPYSAVMLWAILAEVIEKGDADSVLRALELLKEVSGVEMHATFSPTGSLRDGKCWLALPWRASVR
jgi:hypothetical protein